MNFLSFLLKYAAKTAIVTKHTRHTMKNSPRITTPSVRTALFLANTLFEHDNGPGRNRTGSKKHDKLSILVREYIPKIVIVGILVRNITSYLNGKIMNRAFSSEISV
jgi:hypothetical protein